MMKLQNEDGIDNDHVKTSKTNTLDFEPKSAKTEMVSRAWLYRVCYLQVWFQNRRAKFRRSERHAFARRYHQATDVALSGVHRPLTATASTVSASTAVPGYRGAGYPAPAASPTTTAPTDTAAVAPSLSPQRQRSSYRGQPVSSDDFISPYLPSLTPHIMASY